MMDHWYEGMFLVVYLITVLVIIRYWVVAAMDRISKRDRYTVIVASDFGTYTFTGAKVDFVPSTKGDNEPITQEWTAITDAHTDDDMVISSTRVCKGVEEPDDMYGVDLTTGRNQFDDIEKDYPADFYKPGDVKGNNRFAVSGYEPPTEDIAQDLFGVSSEEYLSVAPVIPMGPLIDAEGLGIHIDPPKVYEEIPIEEDDRVVDDSIPGRIRIEVLDEVMDYVKEGKKDD